MDIAQFYDADPRRRSSDEITYGDGWTLRSDKTATYRVNWVCDTGEVYAVREPHPGGLLARYLDQLALDQADITELQVEVLAVVPERAAVERALDGWEQEMESGDSLGWVRGRLTAG